MFVVQLTALLPAEQLVIARAVGDALALVALPSTVFEVCAARPARGIVATVPSNPAALLVI